VQCEGTDLESFMLIFYLARIISVETRKFIELVASINVNNAVLNYQSQKAKN
jgi:hypothetical protein